MPDEPKKQPVKKAKESKPKKKQPSVAAPMGHFARKGKHVGGKLAKLPKDLAAVFDAVPGAAVVFVIDGKDVAIKGDVEGADKHLEAFRKAHAKGLLVVKHSESRQIQKRKAKVVKVEKYAPA